jgi:hypothetical protein
MAHRDRDAGFYRILVAIETDATRYHGPGAARPRLLGQADAEQMLAHVSADLQALLPDISRCSLIAPGALFDQTQILRPGYPVFQGLEAVPTGGGFKPGLVSIGAVDGSMPDPRLQPGDDIPLGLLQLLPLVVHGAPEQVQELGQSMEYRFLEEGQISAHSANWLESAFGVAINHARLMTLTDLNAMLRMQLEHFGFLPLWELLDAAMCESAEALSVTTPSGQDYRWEGEAVHTVFETFDYWSTQGAGRGLPAGGQALASAYAEWTRELRQYLTTLAAHGLELRFRLPGSAETLSGTYFAERSELPAPANCSIVTEHSYGELGTVVITVAEDEGLVNYYPLRASGLNDIHALLRKQVRGGRTIAFPGSIVYDERARRLVPEAGG